VGRVVRAQSDAGPGDRNRHLERGAVHQNAADGKTLGRFAPDPAADAVAEPALDEGRRSPRHLCVPAVAEANPQPGAGCCARAATGQRLTVRCGLALMVSPHSRSYNAFHCRFRNRTRPVCACNPMNDPWPRVGDCGSPLKWNWFTTLTFSDTV